MKRKKKKGKSKSKKKKNRFYTIHYSLCTIQECFHFEFGLRPRDITIQVYNNNSRDSAHAYRFASVMRAAMRNSKIK